MTEQLKQSAQQVLNLSDECWACNGTKLVTTSSNGSGLIEEICLACTQVKGDDHAA